MARDELDRIISKYTERGDWRTEAERDLDDAMDDLFADYIPMHASERLSRQRRKKSPRRARRPRRGTGLTVLSGDAAIQAVQATLAEDERLIVADNGFALEIVEDVEEDETVEGEVVLLRE